MVDTCEVKRANGTTTQDPNTGTTTPGYDTVLTGKCKLQMTTTIARPQEVGGRTSFMVRLELHLPVGSAALQVDDLVTMTAVGDLSDVNLLGRTFRVVGPPAKSLSTALRYEVQEYA